MTSACYLNNVVAAESYKRLSVNNFSITIAEDPAAGAPFLIPMTIVQSNISSTTKGQALRETPTLPRHQLGRRRRTGLAVLQNHRSMLICPFTRTGRSSTSSTKMAVCRAEERRRVSKENCPGPAWSIRPELPWSRRMPSVRIFNSTTNKKEKGTETRSYTQREFS